MKQQKRCAGCMGVYIEKLTTCPHCGMTEADAEKKQYKQALAPNTIIENLRFGQAVDMREDEIVYMGLHLSSGKPVWIHEFFWHGYMKRTPDGFGKSFVSDGEDVDFSGTETIDIYLQKTQAFCKRYPKNIRINDTYYGIQRRYSYKQNKKESSHDTYAIRSIQGARSYQEDTADVVCFPKGFCAVLCDGMGGMQNGNLASEMAVAKMKETAPVVYCCDEAILPMILQEEIVDADTSVAALVNPVGMPLRCGSTLLFVVVRDNRVWLASVGDSHIYRIHDHTITLLTEEHIHLVDLLKQAEEGTISYDEAYAHPKRNALTSYIGMGQLAKLFLSDMQLEPEDRLLLCSDGLYRALSEAEILELADNPTPVAESADRLIQAVEAKALPDQDNTTLILYQFDGKGKRRK